MGPGTAELAIVATLRMRSASTSDTPPTALVMAASVTEWTHRSGSCCTPRRGDAQEASRELLGASHGTTRWAAIPPPPSHLIIPPAFSDASVAGV